MDKGGWQDWMESDKVGGTRWVEVVVGGKQRGKEGEGVTDSLEWVRIHVDESYVEKRGILFLGNIWLLEQCIWK